MVVSTIYFSLMRLVFWHVSHGPNYLPQGTPWFGKMPIFNRCSLEYMTKCNAQMNSYTAPTAIKAFTAWSISWIWPYEKLSEFDKSKPTSDGKKKYRHKLTNSSLIRQSHFNWPAKHWQLSNVSWLNIHKFQVFKKKLP